MPIKPNVVVWGALLKACWFWMDMKLGERVAKKMFSLEPKPLYAYIILSNIYLGHKMYSRCNLIYPNIALLFGENHHIIGDDLQQNYADKSDYGAMTMIDWACQ
ncbi:hypothetical protein F8388_024664 [Cannabis sativa]|uniref:Uncharacterized protein n=1 Tax=Cannabis sativa TaxID=3483 RepID=A0A7J6GBN9_CANSA|nr:hypothetical protein F8388_024664 [Cannabis sativa]